jgi:hypothetical protein
MQFLVGGEQFLLSKLPTATTKLNHELWSINPCPVRYLPGRIF